MTCKRTLPFLIAAALFGTALALPAAAFDGGSTGGDQPTAQISSHYDTLAGSDSNAQALVNGLASGSQITLVTDQTQSDGTTASVDTTFTPATGKLGYGEVNIALALTQAELSAQGITDPTAAQLEAALNGGTITLADGTSVDLQGVLAMRAGGEGWGQIANSLGFNLGALVSASHTDHSQAGEHGAGDAKASGDVSEADHADVRGQARAAAEQADHAEVADASNRPETPDHPVHPDVPQRPDVPDRPDVPQRPDIPERPEIPDHPDVGGRPGG